MKWYYIQDGDGAQVGPVDDAQLADLRYQGTIRDHTLVRREDSTDWVPGSQARAQDSAAPVPPAGTRCSVCGNAFPPDDLITHGNSHVCAACKPVFMQRLAEGLAPIAPPMRYAGFWIRFAAVFVDGIILRIVSAIVALIFGLGLGAAFGTTQQPGSFSSTQILVTLIGFVIGVTYETYLIGKYGATLGKMACKIKVVTPQGEPITYGCSFARYFAKILSALILFIGYIMAAFDPEKRALHDRICNTRVIYK
jgi:uncharacterized RDD family membrane protein YckC